MENKVKCPKCGNLVDTQPALSPQYRKIIKCYGIFKVKLKTKERTETCNYTGFVKHGK